MQCPFHLPCPQRSPQPVRESLEVGRVRGHRRGLRCFLPQAKAIKDILDEPDNVTKWIATTFKCRASEHHRNRLDLFIVDSNMMSFHKLSNE